MGFKAMIHTLAAKARGFPVTSIGSLLDEPFTGVVYLNDSGITTDFRSLRGKKIGYVGEFGKVRICVSEVDFDIDRSNMMNFADSNRRVDQVLRHEAY